ncbi:MAG: hydrolase [Syntrophales bacterium]|jgi:nicotinamidase-related amidase|nr:hydrolase [Syntrophales bacterium]MDY0045637.1 hydrolase [Syntrophales bacterium]
MFKTDTTVLVIIDVQEKLALAMHDAASMIQNLQKIIKGAHILGVPIIATQQINLGPTLPEIKDLIPEAPIIEKRSFSCCGEEGFIDILTQINRNQILVAGIECHICVYQTALDLVRLGYEVQAVADCISSRALANRNTGIERMQREGVDVTSVEMALFELLKVAEGENIRQISRLVK